MSQAANDAEAKLKESGEGAIKYERNRTATPDIHEGTDADKRVSPKRNPKPKRPQWQ